MFVTLGMKFGHVDVIVLGKCTLWCAKRVRVADLLHEGPDPVPGQPVGTVELGLFRRVLRLPSMVYTIMRGMDKEPVRGRSYEAHSFAPPRG